MLLLRISQVTAGLMILGWAAVVFTALFMTGGHPPLSAVVGIVVIVASWLLGSIGAICALAGWRKAKGPKTYALFAVLNLGFLGFAMLVNFM
jgi:hypothetical protein